MDTHATRWAHSATTTTGDAMLRRLMLLALFTGLVSPAAAFDGETRGFMLGGGVGGAVSFVSQDFNEQAFDDFTKLGASFDLRAGWGMSEAIFLYASMRGTWMQYDTVNLAGSDAVHGVFGLGMVQIFDRGRSDWYSTAHLGFAWFDLVEEPRADELTGFGFGAGLGYRFHPNLSIEGVGGWESTTIENAGGEFGNSILTLRLQIVGMAY
jgi:hypothetical protein